jgi:hypothetical protein
MIELSFESSMNNSLVYCTSMFAFIINHSTSVLQVFRILWHYVFNYSSGFINETSRSRARVRQRELVVYAPAEDYLCED